MKNRQIKLWLSASLLVASCSAMADNPTIDRMYLEPFGGYTQYYSPEVGLKYLPAADSYVLSDGSQWYSGAGWASSQYATVTNIADTGETLIFEMVSTAADEIVFQNTDYNGGDHSSQGTLIQASPLIILAEPGATSGIAHGWVRITSNEETWYGLPRFNYYSAPVGSLVPYEVTYELQDNTWHYDILNELFEYTANGWVDFQQVGAVDVAVTTEGGGVESKGHYESGYISYRLIIQNSGKMDAADVVLAHEIPDGTELSSFEISAADDLSVDFSCEQEGSNSLICDIGTFKVGHAYFVDVVVAASNSIKKYEFSSSISTSDPDGKTENNTDLSKYGGSLGLFSLLFGLVVLTRRKLIDN